MLGGLAPSAATHWRSIQPAAFDSRSWDGETVLYVLATGQTHGLDKTTSAVLATLMEHRGVARPAQGWLELMIASDGGEHGPGTAEETQAVDDALMVLHRLAVIERVQP